MWAILPLKPFTLAKQRLAGVLAAELRIGLQIAMACDVLCVLAGHDDIDGVVVVSDDPGAARFAQEHGADFLSEAALGVHGLNPVVQAAVGRFARDGEDEVMIIHGDLPLLTRGEIARLVREHRLAPAPALTIATDRHHDGSNVLLCSASAPLTFAYGKGSCAQHRKQAAQAGLHCHVLTLPGLSRDIDEPEDLFALLESADDETATHTRAYLARSGIARHLPIQELS